MLKIGQIDPGIIFSKRVSSMRTRFPKIQERFEAYRSKVADMEGRSEGNTDRLLMADLSRMFTVTLKGLADIRAVMRQLPEIKLPKEVMSMFFFTLLNAKLLLARIQNVRIVEPPDYSEIADDSSCLKLGPGMKIV